MWLFLYGAAFSASGERTAASAGVFDPALAAVLEEDWQSTMAASPVWATQLGDHRFDTWLPDNSARGRAKYLAKQKSYAERARRLVGLAASDLETRDVYLERMDTAIAVEEACRFSEWSFSARGNAYTTAADLSRSHPVITAVDAGNLVARYQKLPGWIDGEIANLRSGLQQGMAANRISVEKVIAMVDAELAASPENQTLLEPARVEHPDIAPAQLGSFQANLSQAVHGGVRPALTRYRDFLKQEVLPQARGEGREGLTGIALGQACYAARVRQETTTTRSPEEIHQQGLDELDRIHAEMIELGGKVLGISSIEALFKQLRTDPKLHFSTRAEVEQTAESALRRAEAAVPSVFGRLPKAACEVRPIPDHEAPYTTIAYYWPAVPDGGAPGIYYVNSYQPESRTRFDAEVLAFHEAVPGHHFQFAISQELPEMPLFRRHADFTVFVEGWALYTERLAGEMGLYSGDLDRIGMLGFDSWRAARLVVDTGIHAMGWSRGEAEEFMRLNTPLAENNIVNEVDRYVTWPGQALAYKTGQLEILRMRREAEAGLGTRFELSGFHDTLLGGGALPLGLLERRVKAWVESKQRGG